MTCLWRDCALRLLLGTNKIRKALSRHWSLSSTTVRTRASGRTLSSTRRCWISSPSSWTWSRTAISTCIRWYWIFMASSWTGIPTSANTSTASPNTTSTASQSSRPTWWSKWWRICSVAADCHLAAQQCNKRRNDEELCANKKTKIPKSVPSKVKKIYTNSAEIWSKEFTIVEIEEQKLNWEKFPWLNSEFCLR